MSYIDDNKCKHVFIIGCKGIPAQYGGYETFVDMLTKNNKNKNIKYHVACALNKEDYNSVTRVFRYNGADCVNIPWKNIGPAKAIIYDIDALRIFIDYIKRKNINKPIFYILACRIGPFINHYKKIIERIGGTLYVNPDGHEWMRQKWSPVVRKYWKISERLMVKHSDLLICDSKNIEKYIQTEYQKYSPKTTFIAYGADSTPSKLEDDDNELLYWYDSHNLSKNEYYLVVGRFVPENNYEIMIREFMKSNTTKSFALITEVSDKFIEELKKKTHFDKDNRIKFVGTVYNKELLKKIRENAFAYLHGHEVGGTNPSLLESLNSTSLNMLLDVGFNREVAEQGAIYWNKTRGSLSGIIDKAETMSSDDIEVIGNKAKERIRKYYSWDYIVSVYEELFYK